MLLLVLWGNWELNGVIGFGVHFDQEDKSVHTFTSDIANKINTITIILYILGNLCKVAGALL